MCKVITLGLQKGGVSKTTTTGTLAHLLSKNGYRVLVIDMDSQGNSTELLTDTPTNDFSGKSVLEAIIYREPKKYVYTVNDNLHILPANNFLATFYRWVYRNEVYTGEKVIREGKVYDQLSETVDLLKDEYDYILIDTPPSLSELTTNALVASDYVIVLFESSKFCYSAVPNFMNAINTAREKSSKKVKPIGILRTLNDKRRNDAKFFNELIESDYPALVFDTIITRKASTGRLAFYGFEDNSELSEAISQYEQFYKEFLLRIREDETNE